MSRQLSMFDHIYVDNFAGGGGASTGIELATGHPIDIAINHDESAIMMHKRNHPFTEHYREDVWKVDPKKATRGRPVRLAWFSPDCKHFSRAKGAALVDKKIRGLAWIVLRWAGLVRPDVIMLENVPEFVTWCPVRKGKPVKKKIGQTYKKWLNQLMELGYKVESRVLCAADYGAPTIRRRFCLIARCDNKPIVFPEPTHAPRNSPEVKSGKLKAWRSAAEIIDFNLPCYSIFDTKKDIKEKYGVRVNRPLKPNTLRRIAKGLEKFVIKSQEPFLIPIGYGERQGQAPRVNDIKEPLSTVVSSIKQYLCDPVISPYIMSNNGQNVPKGMAEPVPTITAGNRNYYTEAQLSPFVIESNHNTDRFNKIGKPLNTITAKYSGGLVAPTLIQYHSEQHGEDVRGQGLRNPLLTVDGSNRYGLAAMHLTQYFSGDGHYHSVDEPLATITTMEREGLTAAYLSEFYGNAKDGIPLNSPIHTVTSKDRECFVSAFLSKFYRGVIGSQLNKPLPTVTAVDHNGLIEVILVKYKGSQKLGHWEEVRDLLNNYADYWIADDEVLLFKINNAFYFISDIGLRMLTPRELYDAMGFPHDYIIDKDIYGNKITRTAQVARCGNAVCPPLATAMVRANLPEECPPEAFSDMQKVHQTMVS